MESVVIYVIASINREVQTKDNPLRLTLDSLPSKAGGLPIVWWVKSTYVQDKKPKAD